MADRPSATVEVVVGGVHLDLDGGGVARDVIRLRLGASDDPAGRYELLGARAALELGEALVYLAGVARRASEANRG